MAIDTIGCFMESKNIIVMDKDTETQQLFSSVIQEMDYTAHVLSTPEELESVARATRPDLVFINLDDFDERNMHVFRQLHTLDIKLPIFVMTEAQEEVLPLWHQLCAEAVPFHFIRKPIGEIEIQAFLHSVLGPPYDA